MTRFLIVPQWQGSPSPRAMQLADGADAIAGDLPRSATVRVEVPLEAGDALGSDVRRLSALLQVRARLDEALAASDEPAMVIGGDCSVAVGAIAHAARAGGRLAVVWADAHPDLHDPASSASHAFSGMSLRAALGEGVAGLALPPGAIDPAAVVLAGTRALDDAEAAYVQAHGIRMLGPDALADPGVLAAAVEATGADRVYVHVDLDVLDPAEMPGVKAAEPFGVPLADLTASLRSLRERLPLQGSSIAEFIPASPADAAADLGTILRIVGALA